VFTGYRFTGYIYFISNCHIFVGFFYKKLCYVLVSRCVKVCHIHDCQTCENFHICHKDQCHVPLVIECVIRGLLVTDFNKVRRGREGSKSDSKDLGVNFVKCV
jgi:hypothetical protein